MIERKSWVFGKVSAVRCCWRSRDLMSWWNDREFFGRQFSRLFKSRSSSNNPSGHFANSNSQNRSIIHASLRYIQQRFITVAPHYVLMLLDSIQRKHFKKSLNQLWVPTKASVERKLEAKPGIDDFNKRKFVIDRNAIWLLRASIIKFQLDFILECRMWNNLWMPIRWRIWFMILTFSYVVDRGEINWCERLH